MRVALRQTVVYWPPAGSDNYGQPTYGTATEFPCRWESTSRKVRGPGGEEVLAQAEVWVGRDLAVGGALMLGTLDDLDSALAPPPGLALPILQFESIPDLTGRNPVRRAVL